MFCGEVITVEAALVVVMVATCVVSVLLFVVWLLLLHAAMVNTATGSNAGRS